MKKAFLLLIVFACIYTFAYVPATADYVLFLKDFETLNSFLPQGSKLKDQTEGFVCFFGKITLNLSSLMGFIETEEIQDAQSVLDTSVVTDDPEWVKKNFSALLADHQAIEANGLYYFVSPRMLEDVNAMIKNQIPKMELNTDATIYARIQTIPVLGIVLHLFGFNEGIPTDDEISVVFDSDTAKILLRSNKFSKFGWEVDRARSQTLPEGLKTLKDAQFSLAMPTLILNQVPSEIMEEFELDLEEFGFIFSKASAVSLSFSEEESKHALFFDFKAESLEDLIGYFEEFGVFVRRTEDFVYLNSDELIAVFPVKGGIAEVLSPNVDEKDLIPVEGGVMGRFILNQEGIFADLSLYREGCSVVMEAKLSKDLILYVFQEILVGFLPKPEELKILNSVIDSVDFQCYYMYMDPPENIVELDVVPEDFLERVFYERKEEDGGWLVTVGVETDLVETMTEQDVINSLSVVVDSVRIDQENRFIYVTKWYEKYKLPSVEQMIIDFVNGIRYYYEDYESVPEDLTSVLYWYIDRYYPDEVLDMITYEQEPSGDKTTIKLSIKTDQEINESLFEELNLKDFLYKDGVLTVIFELP
ncbi:MAG: hypothetical protein ACK4E2_06310 [Pseudothermotoga sp.]